jgi:hypothetical protein
MLGTGKSRSRRAEIRKNRPEASWLDLAAFRDSGAGASLLIAFAFGVIASGVMMFREGVSRTQLGGIALSSIGVLVIVAQGRLELLRSLAFNWGDIIILFNMVIFAVYAVCLRLLPPLHWLSFIFVLAVLSAVTTLPFALWEAAAGIVVKPDWLTLGAVIYVSIFPNSKITGVTRYGKSGPGPDGSVMTVNFELDGQRFTALNAGPQFKFTEAISLVVNPATTHP